MPRKKSFKPKRNQEVKPMANFYSLIDTFNNLDEDEELLETIKENQLDGTRLSSELE